MAGAARGVLERTEKKVYMDDSIPLTATITTHRALPSYVEFVMRVQRGSDPEDSWEACHRYSEFSNLHQLLQVSGINLTFPPKKLFGANDRQFLIERQQGLQEFLNAVLTQPLFSSALEVKRFLDPQNYSDNFYENALRDVSMFFRSEPNWNIVEPLKDIGLRIRKQYYLIASKSDPKSPKHLLSWCEPGPDFCLGEREVDAALKVLVETKHPHVLSPVSASFNGAGLMVVRMFNPGGSLRDAIYGCKPQQHFLHKYSHSPRVPALTPAQIRSYSKQVLEAVNFLSGKGFVLGHIHPGNVIVDKGGCCKLVDIENVLMGLPLLYRQNLLPIRKIHKHVDQTVYSFGHLLYEMSSGKPLTSPTMDELPPDTPACVVPILEMLLSPQAIKNGLPSLTDLLSNSFFSEIGSMTGVKPTMKVPSKLKEVLQGMLDKGEVQLREQQRRVSHFKKVSRAHESLMSEEEKKKRRKKQKKQLSLQSVDEPQPYPVSKQLPRQQTIASSQPTTHEAKHKSPSSKSTAQSSTASSKVPPPPSTQPPTPVQQAPQKSDSNRGALLGAIEGFSKNKLKKSVTNDRSGPLGRR